jgi:predicted Zn-dependent peptidase
MDYENLEERVYILMEYIDELYELKRDKSFYFRNKLNDEIIGVEEDLKEYTGKWYHPNNMGD